MSRFWHRFHAGALMQGWVLALGCLLAACGDGCCGCGGLDCGPLEEWASDFQQEQVERTRAELVDIDPVAHRFIREQRPILAAVGGSITTIEYRMLVGLTDVSDGLAGGETAKKIGYRVIGPGGELLVTVIMVQRGGTWVAAAADFGTTHVGEAITFTLPPPPPSTPSSSGGGGGGGGSWGGGGWD